MPDDPNVQAPAEPAPAAELPTHPEAADLDTAERAVHDEVKANLVAAAQHGLENLPDTTERTTFLQKLEEALFWALKAIVAARLSKV